MRISDWSSDVCASDLPSGHSSVALHKVLQKLMTVLGQDRLRVKLHAFDRQRLVAQPHDFIDTTIGALRPRGNVEAIRQAILFNHQRVVARRLIRCRQRSEEHTTELQSLMRISYAVFCLK